MFDTRPARPMKNLSVSKIEKFLLCPKNFELSYIHKIPQQGVWKVFAGKVVHSVIEHALREYSQTGVYPDAKTMDDLYEPTWTQMLEEEESKDWFIGWQEDPKDPVEKVKTQYRPLVTLARKEVLPTLAPWMMENDPVVEWKIELEMRSRVGPFPLLGYADLLSAKGVLMDWKTTEANEEDEISARAKRTWLQFAAYSLWAYPIVGEEDLKCEKIFLVRGKNGPRVERVPFVVGPKHRNFFVNLAAQVWETIHHKIFIANSDTWLCKPDFCPYYSGCMGDLKKKEEALCPVPSPSPNV